MCEGHITIIVSLDVKGPIHAYWWPSILKTLREFQCPKNSYNLAKSSFSERTATMSTNRIQMARAVTKGCPQGSCCSPGFWNIQFNSLLNLELETKTKAIAFADDLLIAVRAKTVREAENYTNIEINKIMKWARQQNHL